MLATGETGRAVWALYAWLGMGTGAAGLIGMFRNVTDAVAIVADVNNYLLPLWMIVFGIGLLRHRFHHGRPT